MGWLFSRNWTSRADMVAHLRRPERFGDTHTLLHSSVVGNHHWYLVRYNADQKIYIGLDLMQGGTHKHPGWGYKDLDESMGPCEVDCPLGFLDRASPAEGYAVEWRESVREFHRQKALKPKPAAGLVVAYAGISYKLVGPIAPRRGWYVDRVEDGHRFKMPAKMLAQALMSHGMNASV